MKKIFAFILFSFLFGASLPAFSCDDQDCYEGVVWYESVEYGGEDEGITQESLRWFLQQEQDEENSNYDY